MNKRRIKIISVVILLLLVAITAFTIYQINSSNRDDQDEVEDTNSLAPEPIGSSLEGNEYTESQVEACWDLIGNNLNGKWIYQGGDFEQNPYIILQEDGTFIIFGFGGDGENVSGEWKFDRPNISLIFNSDNTYWNDELVEDINTLYDSITFDPNTNTLRTMIGHITRAEDFTGECKEEFFHIDMLNIFLHKES